MCMRILITDDHPVFRNGIKSLLQGTYNEIIIYEASDGEQALEIISRHQIDVLLLDISMPVMSGLDFLQHLRKIRPIHFKIIVLTLYNDDVLIQRLLELKVDGYLAKNLRAGELRDAIESVLNGVLYFPTRYDARIRNRIHSGRTPSFKVSKNELSIIQLLSQGNTSKEISSKLGYTLRTVETKRQRLERKFHVRSSAELISIAYRLGYLSPSSFD